MASSKEFRDYVLEQLAELNVTSRPKKHKTPKSLVQCQIIEIMECIID